MAKYINYGQVFIKCISK